MALGEKTGGRRAGTPNKRTAATHFEAAEGGILPLGYMLDVMRSENAEEGRRDDMAKAAAPYLHARPKGRTIAIELPPLKTTADGLDALNVVIAAVSCGEITIDEGQQLAALVGEHRKAIEMVALEERIQELENRK